MTDMTIEPEDLDETEAERPEEPAEPEEPAAGDEEVAGEGDEAVEDEPPPPPPAPAAAPRPTPKPVKALPKGFVPLPVVPVGDPRVPLDATTLAEATICATVFRRLAEHADAQVAAILASDDEMPPFYVDEEDAALLANLFATDVALASRIRLAAGSTPRPAVV